MTVAGILTVGILVFVAAISAGVPALEIGVGVCVAQPLARIRQIVINVYNGFRANWVFILSLPVMWYP